MEIWYISGRPTTRWKKIMAKINVRIPEPKKQYEVDNQRQITRALRIVTEQLNSTFLQDLKESQERFTWFGLG
jgi:hypothetical protein